MATEAGPSFRQSHGALCEGTHPFATPVFGVAVTLGIILGSLKQEPPSPFRGNELSLAAAVEIPHYPPWVLNSGKLVWRPWDRRSGFQVGVMVVSGTGAGLNRCGMLPASVLQPTSAFPRLLFPSPVNVTLKQLGRGVGWECGGKWKGECQGLLCRAGARSCQNRRQQRSAYRSSMQMSLLSFLLPLSAPEVTGLWCPAWCGAHLFQRSCLGRLMNSSILSTEFGAWPRK